jgi:rhamnose transport system substrate-binding protein
MINELVAQKVDAIAIAGNDFDALQPALKKAMEQGIKVLSLDASVNKDSRMVHINQADSEKIGRTLIQATKEMVKGEGQIAILSATSQAANQNTWIEWMKKELEEGDYKGLDLVKIAYGDDEFQKSVDETEALLKNYPDLKAIIAPTTVGIMAAAKVVTDKGLIGKVAVTGLGLPSEMAEYIANGSCPWMYLWNPIDVGGLAAHASIALVKGDITGVAGDKFEAGTLGSYEVISAADGGTEVLLGAPFKFDPDNIDEWKSVY